jgi:hypothetical protein
MRTSFAVAALAVVAATTGCAASAHVEASPTRQAPSAAAYEQQVQAVLRDWGSIAVQGMRPAIRDLSSPGGVPRAGIATEADAWTAALKHDRQELQGIAAPPSYEPTRQLLLRSLNGYLRGAAIVHRAAQQSDPARRETTLERAVRVLTAADAVYNQAVPNTD